MMITIKRPGKRFCLSAHFYDLTSEKKNSLPCHISMHSMQTRFQELPFGDYEVSTTFVLDNGYTKKQKL